MDKLNIVNFVKNGTNYSTQTMRNSSAFQKFPVIKTTAPPQTQLQTTKTDIYDSNTPVHPVKSFKNIINIIDDSYVDEAIVGALALGGIIFTAVHYGGVRKMINSLMQQLTDLKAKHTALDSTVTSFGQTIKTHTDDISNLATAKATGTALDELSGKVDSLEKSALTQIQSSAGNYMTREVKIYGADGPTLKLSTSQVSIDRAELSEAGQKVYADFQKEMKTQAAKGIFGIKDLSKLEGVTDPQIRIVSVELNPFHKVGGLATVPAELAQELPKVIQNPNARIYLDMPMYTGGAYDNYWKLVGNSANGYRYQKFSNGKLAIANSKTNTPADYAVKLIDEFTVDILGEKSQKVRLFQHERAEKFPFAGNLEELFKTQRKDVYDAIKQALAHNQTYETPAYRIYMEGAKPVFETKMTYNFWNNEKFNLDFPMNASGKTLYSNEASSSGEKERFTCFCRYVYDHTLGLFEKNNGRLLDENGKVTLGADAFVLNDWHTGALAAMMRVGTIAKKYNQSFDPVVADKMINTPVISLLHNVIDGAVGCGDEKTRVVRQDLISKLFRIMFGENAAAVVENAKIPDVSKFTTISAHDIQKHNIANGCMRDWDFSPLQMLATYSDSLHPVSEGYAKECTRYSEVGKDFLALFKLRSKEDLSAQKIKSILTQNDMNFPEELLSRLSDDDLTHSTFEGITNGLNKYKNILTEESKGGIEKLYKDTTGLLDSLLPEGERATVSLRTFDDVKELINNPNKLKEVLDWKLHNKREVLPFLKASVKYSAQNPKQTDLIKVLHADMTDLTGVTEKTPIFWTAGRIDKQKGYDTYLKAIEKYIKTIDKNAADTTDFPIFTIQGKIQGDEYCQHVVTAVKDLKTRLTKDGYKRAADRILLLDEGRDEKYSISKILTDFNVMASDYEPCGLSHKEFMNYSGGLCIGNKTGGIPSGLEGQKSFIGAELDPKHTLLVDNKYVNDPDFEIRGTNYFEKIKEGLRRWNDAMNGTNNDFAEGVAQSLKNDFTWSNPGGSAEKYIDAIKRAGLKKGLDTVYPPKQIMGYIGDSNPITIHGSVSEPLKGFMLTNKETQAEKAISILNLIGKNPNYSMIKAPSEKVF